MKKLTVLMMFLMFSFSVFSIEALTVLRAENAHTYGARIVGGKMFPARCLDHNSSDVTTIGWYHKITHDEDGWSGVVEIDLGNAEYTALVLDSHATLGTHLVWMLETSASTKIYIIGSATAAQDVEIPTINNNANSALSPLANMYWVDGVISDGYIWDAGKSGATKNSGGTSFSMGEKVTAPGQQVGISILSEGATNNMLLHWSLYYKPVN